MYDWLASLSPQVLAASIGGLVALAVAFSRPIGYLFNRWISKASKRESLEITEKQQNLLTSSYDLLKTKDEEIKSLNAQIERSKQPTPDTASPAPLPHPQEALPEPTQGESGTSDSFHWIELISERQHQRARAAFDKAQQDVTDPATKRDREVAFLYLSAIHQSQESFAKLESLIDDPDVGFNARLRLAMLLSESGDRPRSEALLTQVIMQGSATKLRVLAAKHRVEMLAADGRNADAAHLGLSYLRQIRPQGADSLPLLAAIAASLKGEDAITHAALLALARSIAPADQRIAFDAAYAAADAELRRVAMSFYRPIAGNDAEAANATNNLGVIYHELGMVGMSMASYADASSAGSTLASANLANHAIESGFLELATTHLDRARHAESMHENVGPALARLAASKARERKEVDDLAKVGALEAQFLVDYALAWTSDAPIAHPLQSTWTDVNGRTYTVRSEDAQIEIRTGESYSEETISLAGPCRASSSDVIGVEFDESPPHKRPTVLGRAFALINSDYIRLLVRLADERVELLHLRPRNEVTRKS